MSGFQRLTRSRSLAAQSEGNVRGTEGRERTTKNRSRGVPEDNATKKNNTASKQVQSQSSKTKTGGTPDVFRKPGAPPSDRKRRRGGGDVSNDEEQFEEFLSQSSSRSHSQQKSQSSSKGSQQSPSKSQSRSHGRKTESGSRSGVDFSDVTLFEGRELSEDEMAQNIINFFFVMQKKLHPVRKTDLIKIPMNKQSEDFKDVIEKVQKDLRMIFGVKLIGIRNGADGNLEKCDVTEATSYIIESVFRQQIMRKVNPVGNRKESEIFSKAALMMIVTCIYMSGKQLTEDQIWDLLEKMEFSDHLCKKREDLKRFLKSEYVDTLYLTKVEEKHLDEVTVRYGLGLRFDLELNKFMILKNTAQFLDKEPEDFTEQYSKIPEKEIKAINEELENNEDEGDQGSDLEEENDTTEEEDDDGFNVPTPIQPPSQPVASISSVSKSKPTRRVIRPLSSSSDSD